MRTNSLCAPSQEFTKWVTKNENIFIPFWGQHLTRLEQLPRAIFFGPPCYCQAGSLS